MVMITLDVPKELNKKIEYFKIEHELKDKREAIVIMIRQAAYNQKEHTSIEEVFKEVDMLSPIKISIGKLKKMKEEMYER